MAGKATLNKEHPLAGVVLCFTSILPEQRSELASIAGQMGATHTLDLTSDVTHLLVGETNTPKYKFVARERADIVVLKPEWVEAVRQSWMQGGDTDIRALEEQYKFQTFTGLAICITGFEDMAFRNHIQTNATAHGADFRKDLTKTVTHLVARSTEGEKYKFATQWNIKVVTVNWFTDCIERGMVLEETLYHPLLPAEQQGAGAWNRSITRVKEKPQENESSSNPRPRKLRRIASAKLGDQNEGIWGDIVGIGFEPGDFGRPKSSQQKNDSRKANNRPSVLQEAKSFASDTTFAAPSQPLQQPQEAAARQNGFLDDCFFLIHGFSSKQITVLQHHLSFNGAQLVNSLSEFARPDIPKRGHNIYIIVPYKTPQSRVPSTDDFAFDCDIVTDMWLERCLDAKTLVTPESHVANTPLSSFPLDGFAGMKICSTGFSRIDLLHLSKLVTLVGATYQEYLTPKASILICNDAIAINHEKLRHTHEWGVPAVTPDWLWSSIRMEKKQQFEPYLIRKQSTQSSKDPESRASSRGEPKREPEDNTKTNTITLPHGSNSSNKPKTPLPNPPKEIEISPRPTTRGAPQAEEPIIERKSLSISEPKPQPAPSPAKHPEPNLAESPSMKRKFSDQSSASAAQSAIEIDLAVSGLLKQARATTTTTTTTTTATSRSTSGTGDAHDQLRSRRAKPLLGRAQSNVSVRTTEQKGFSRASSIDTLNEDGCGSAIESINTDAIPSLANSGRFEYPEGERGNYQEEQETPPMTQLDYEDPDAVAMREKFLRYAGKIIEEPSNKQKLVIGEVKELEEVGWGTGRRTRNAHKAVVDDDDDDDDDF
ncbi:hypothetical protein P175DRAFT_0498721 [Aspergillus ochraceoroseus IBT 24754]|uniref:BRCT domain-containing protein n=1 Tax=Aspergillus ochraceoroseus IBT 24754 TaxID=1392256 RepID=A0A2T5MAR1_9EURO|nr:uncharacterized protein P175DRAFT_0498721 [Aspergillus ochraceoroseus IBT 24754]PTU25623.1 hypothetical protein P175DRAFT_0498721 [Aspergillus ochraceoroseus IBT 24754]